MRFYEVKIRLAKGFELLVASLNIGEALAEYGARITDTTELARFITWLNTAKSGEVSWFPTTGADFVLIAVESAILPDRIMASWCSDTMASMGRGVQFDERQTSAEKPEAQEAEGVQGRSS
jgi:hypothetical protein